MHVTSASEAGQLPGSVGLNMRLTMLLAVRLCYHPHAGSLLGMALSLQYIATDYHMPIALRTVKYTNCSAELHSACIPSLGNTLGL